MDFNVVSDLRLRKPIYQQSQWNTLNGLEVLT